MHNYSIIKSIFAEPWAIMPEAIDAYGHILASLLTPNLAMERGEAAMPQLLASAGKASKNQTKAVQVIHIKGALTKEDQFCGPAGMQRIGRWIQQADAEPEIGSIILVFDSPGGTVVGTEELGNIIKDTQKPILAFVEDMACSAAYWLASCCDTIIANNTTARVGSIGVMLTAMDVEPRLKNMGINTHTILSNYSKDKNADWQQIKEGNYETYQKEVLDPLAEKFINLVNENRGQLNEKFTTGKVFFAQDLVGTLIDNIGDFDYAIEQAMEMQEEAASEDLTPEATTPKTKIDMSKYQRLATASGVETFESADGSISLTEEQADAVEQTLEAAETANANLATMTQERDQANERITELEATVATLEKKPGAESGKIITDTDGGTDGSQEADFFDHLGECQEYLNGKN